MENRDEKIAASITKEIKKQSKKYNTSVLVSCAGEYDYLHGVRADLLIISPEAKLNAKKALNAKCILLPGGLLDSLNALKTDYVISYGMSARDTITASSISEDGVLISLQRELVTLNGEIVERQELPAIPLKHSTPERIMSVRGALLLLGLQQ